jgi:cysteine desulfurase/selenocysteine lyase
MNAEEVRKDFPIFRNRPELVYLDNAATTQKPENVIEAVSEFYRNDNSNEGRGLYEIANRATELYAESRRTVGNFLNASSQEIVFTRNTTESMNLIAESLDFEGDVVVPEMAHHSNQLPWRRAAERKGYRTKFIPTEDNRLDLEAAKELIDEDTAVVSVSHISNVFGCVNPVEELAEIAHDNDAVMVVDGAQSAPHMEVDVKELGADFFAFSGHKMMAPTGSGGFYGRKELLEEMEPYQVGGGMIKSVKKDSIRYGDAPEKFEAGTPNIGGAVGLKAAVEYLQEIGMEKISSHEEKIAGEIAERLSQIEGVEVWTPENFSLVSFTMDGAHPHDVAEVLSQQNVAVRAGHHCAQPQMEKLNSNGTTRASPYIYNTMDDVEQLVEGVKKAREVF